MYGTKYGRGNEFYRIDRDTGELTVVGLVIEKFHTLAFRGDGKLYGARFSRAYEIDYNDTSGQYLSLTDVSDVFNHIFLDDMEFHPETNLAYGSVSTEDLYAVDTEAGVAHEVGPLEAGFRTLAFVHAIPGDFDGDGDVDGVDIAEMFSNFNGPGGGTPTNPDTDTDLDGDVDGVDIGQLFGLFTGPLAPANVPEPGAIAMMAFGGLWLSGRQRRNS